MAKQIPQEEADLSWLTVPERAALAELAEKKEMSRVGIIRMALRTFQLIDSGGATLTIVEPPGKYMHGCGAAD